jgi:hypothetical protein
VVRFPAGTREFLFCTASRPTLVCYLWDLSLEVKQLGHDPSNDEIKNVWSYTYIPLINLHGMVLN